MSSVSCDNMDQSWMNGKLPFKSDSSNHVEYLYENFLSSRGGKRGNCQKKRYLKYLDFRPPQSFTSHTKSKKKKKKNRKKFRDKPM